MQIEMGSARDTMLSHARQWQPWKISVEQMIAISSRVLARQPVHLFQPRPGCIALFPRLHGVIWHDITGKECSINCQTDLQANCMLSHLSGFVRITLFTFQ